MKLQIQMRPMKLNSALCPDVVTLTDFVDSIKTFFKLVKLLIKIFLEFRSFLKCRRLWQKFQMFKIGRSYHRIKEGAV
jgi:hypothetical protein